MWIINRYLTMFKYAFKLDYFVFIIVILNNLPCYDTSFSEVDSWPKHYVDEMECAGLHERHLPVPQVCYESFCLYQPGYIRINFFVQQTF